MTSSLLDSKSFSFDSAAPPFQIFNPSAAEKKIIAFIRRTVKKSGAKGIVLGLSGGIDSALAAVLSSKAIGAENVFPIFFYDLDNADSSSTSTDFSSSDLKDAALLCDKFSLSLQKINLHAAFESARFSFDENKSNADITQNPIIDGNLKSRLRMSLLYYYANQNNLLVLGTKNKTERMIGYFTKYGDGGVDLDPIADLYKTEIRLLSAHLNLPTEILNKIPSAGFWDGQSDEADIGISYDQLDWLLLELEQNEKPKKDNQKKAPEKLLKRIGLTQKQYNSILSRMKAAEHKQKIPAFPKIS